MRKNLLVLLAFVFVAVVAGASEVPQPAVAPVEAPVLDSELFAPEALEVSSCPTTLQCWPSWHQNHNPFECFYGCNLACGQNGFCNDTTCLCECSTMF
jgi:hypothetical protein